jgi:hypothetical protein
MSTSPAAGTTPVLKARFRCKKKFLYYFKKGFSDPTYVAWERQYKWDAHLQFQEALHETDFQKLLEAREYRKIAEIATRIESRTNLLFSFEKMALRDAVKSAVGAKTFATGLFNYLYGKDTLQKRFESYVEIIASLPRKQTRVLTWPLVTVFGFIGNPKEHIFLKPRVTQIAAEKYKYDFPYSSRPNWATYQSLFNFANQIKADAHELKPKDYIDLQSFIWVMGSEEYPD